MNTKIQTALIGCGRRGRLHTAGMLKDPRYDIVAVCDIDLDAAKKLTADFGLDNAKIYTSYDQMLDELRPELVVQALWPQHRLAVYKSCVKYGVKHMVSEKPFADNFGDARELRRLALESDCRLSYTHQRRFSPANRKVRELLAAGAIGDVTRVDLYAYRHLLDCGTHTLDQLWSYLGDIPVSRVYGSLELEGSVKWFDVPGEGSFAGTVIYENGLYGSIFAGLGEKRPEQSGVTLYGTKGYMELGWEGRLYSYASLDMQSELAELASWSDGDCCGDNIALMWRYLADCRDSGDDVLDNNEINWRHAYNAVEVIFALYESVRTSSSVTLPLKGVDGNPLKEIIANK